MGQKTKNSQSGFTLVELAIALVIVGLLLGGVLKGQELLENARISATLTQTKSIESASILFKDTYGYLPGDMLNATTRLPDCTPEKVCMDGNGDGRISDAGGMDLAPNANINVAGENSGFFIHMSLADMIDGVTAHAALDPLPGQSANPAFALGQPIYMGQTIPATFGRGNTSTLHTYTLHKGARSTIAAGAYRGYMRSYSGLRTDRSLINQQPRIFYAAAGAAPPWQGPVVNSDPEIYRAKMANAHFRIGYTSSGIVGLAQSPQKRGHYLMITGAPLDDPGVTTLSLTALQAFRIDQKIDDGLPLVGGVIAGGFALFPTFQTPICDCVDYSGGPGAWTGEYKLSQKGFACGGVYIYTGT